MASTTFDNKCAILSDVWINFRFDSQFTDFIQYNDLGLPLAYAITEGIAKPAELSNKFIDETFDLLLAALNIEEDTGFSSLDDMLVFDVGGME
jgi:hypothetical protein